jgi:hypothetical protein
MGTCPVCNGTGQTPLSDHEKNYPWNKGKETGNCINCGGQYMSGIATGKVRLDKSGKPCKHKYTHYLAGKCYHHYICDNCGDEHYIDSGD